MFPGKHSRVSFQLKADKVSRAGSRAGLQLTAEKVWSPLLHTRTVTVQEQHHS